MIRARRAGGAGALLGAAGPWDRRAAWLAWLRRGKRSRVGMKCKSHGDLGEETCPSQQTPPPPSQPPQPQGLLLRVMGESSAKAQGFVRHESALEPWLQPAGAAADAGGTMTASCSGRWEASGEGALSSLTAGGSLGLAAPHPEDSFLPRWWPAGPPQPPASPRLRPSSQEPSVPSTWLASARTPRSRGHRSWLCLGDKLRLLTRGRPPKGLAGARGGRDSPLVGSELC